MAGHTSGLGEQVDGGGTLPADRRPGVYLLDDHERVRAGVAALLEGTGEFRVVGQGGSVADGVRDLLDARLPASVAVLDVGLGDGDGIELCRQVTAERPDLAVLILTAHGDEATVARAEAAGAAELVVKQLRADALLAALRRAARPPA